MNAADPSVALTAIQKQAAYILKKQPALGKSLIASHYPLKGAILGTICTACGWNVQKLVGKTKLP